MKLSRRNFQLTSLHLIHGSPAHPSPQPKRQLDRCSRFCRAHYCDRQTDRPRYSVGKNRHLYVRSTAMRPKNYAPRIKGATGYSKIQLEMAGKHFLVDASFVSNSSTTFSFCLTV